MRTILLDETVMIVVEKSSVDVLLNANNTA